MNNMVNKRADFNKGWVCVRVIIVSIYACVVSFRYRVSNVHAYRISFASDSSFATVFTHFATYVIYALPIYLKDLILSQQRLNNFTNNRFCTF